MLSSKSDNAISSLIDSESIKLGTAYATVFRRGATIIYVIIELNRNMRTEAVLIEQLNQIRWLDATDQKLLKKEVGEFRSNFIESCGGFGVDSFATISSLEIEDCNVVINLLASINRGTTLLCSDWALKEENNRWFKKDWLRLLTYGLGVRLTPTLSEPLIGRIPILGIKSEFFGSFCLFGNYDCPRSVFHSLFGLTPELSVVTELTNSDTGDFYIIYEQAENNWFADNKSKNMIIFRFSEGRFEKMDIGGQAIRRYEDISEHFAAIFGKKVEKHQFHSYLIEKEFFGEVIRSMEFLLNKTLLQSQTRPAVSACSTLKFDELRYDGYLYC